MASMLPGGISHENLIKRVKKTDKEVHSILGGFRLVLLGSQIIKKSHVQCANFLGIHKGFVLMYVAFHHVYLVSHAIHRRNTYVHLVFV